MSDNSLYIGLTEIAGEVRDLAENVGAVADQLAPLDPLDKLNAVAQVSQQLYVASLSWHIARGSVIENLERDALVEIAIASWRYAEAWWNARPIERDEQGASS